MTAPDTPRPWHRSPLLPPALIVVGVLISFAPALSAGFTNWDDDYNFTKNPNFRGLSPQNLRWMFSTFLMGHWHPLTWVTLGLDYSLWGMNATGYHLTNVLIHAANAVLLYFLIGMLLRLGGSPPTTPWPAMIGALFYAVHPLRVESVAWVTERRDVLCGLFTLLSLLAWLRKVDEERQGRPSTKWFVWSVVAFAAALMSKALAIMLPAVLLILDLYPLRRFTPGERWRRLLEKVPFGLVSIADLAAMLAAMRSIRAVHSIESYNLVERLAQAAYGLGFYVEKLVWPTGLVPIHRLETPMNPFAVKYVVAALAVVAGTAVLVALRRRMPGGLAAWLCYGVLVLPVLGVAVTGKQLAADRYTYLSLLPASVVAAALVARLPLSRTAGAAVVIAVLAGLTWRQCGFWKDSVTLWSRQIDVDPGCDTAWHNRAKALHEKGDAAGALEDCDRSLAVNPRFAKSYNLRGLIRRQGGDTVAARADFDRALSLDPSNASALTNRGELRRAQGDLNGALEDAAAALQLDPQSASAHFIRAEVFIRQNRLAEAVTEYDLALVRQPDDPFMLVGRGQARYRLGDRAGAVLDLERALSLAPAGWSIRKDIETMVQQLRRQ